jgi:hypothetical protein
MKIGSKATHIFADDLALGVHSYTEEQDPSHRIWNVWLLEVQFDVFLLAVDHYCVVLASSLRGQLGWQSHSRMCLLCSPVIVSMHQGHSETSL